MVKVKENALEVLVVENLAENRAAALKALNEEGAVVELAPAYVEGVGKLGKGGYDFALLDLRLEERGEGLVQNLGLVLARLADEKLVPWAILTQGFYKHDNSQATFARYFWEGVPSRELLNGLSEGDALDSLLREGFELIKTPKSNPDTWRVAYERLLHPLPESDPRYAALKRQMPRNPAKALFLDYGRLIKASLRNS